MTKRRHHRYQPTLHTWFTVGLAITCILILLLAPSISLAVVLVFLLVFVAGHGLIHARAGTLTRDGIIEYALVALVVLIVLGGALRGAN